jgi:hypothetical protein
MSIQVDSLRALVRGNLIDQNLGKILLDLVIFPAAPGESDAERCSRFLLNHLGMHFSSAYLRPVPRSDAAIVAATILSPNPWGGRTTADADARIRQLCLEFGDDVRVIASRKYQIEGKEIVSSKCQGPDLLGMTLERGLIALDSQRVGILWIGDED